MWRSLRHGLRRVRPRTLTVVDTRLCSVVDLPPNYSCFSRRLFSSVRAASGSPDASIPPSKRFDPSRTEQEWIELTQKLLDPSTASFDTPQHVLEAAGAIRWWSTQRTPQGVENSFQLYDRIVMGIDQHPELLDSQDLIHWHEGRYPRATHLLNAALDSWRIVWLRGGSVLQPHQVLEAFGRLYRMGVPLDRRTYSIIMHAAVQRGNKRTAPLLCEQILQRMLERGHDYPPALPDTVAFTEALHAWAKSGREDAAQRAQELWQEMIALHDDRVVDAAPNKITFKTLLEALRQDKTRQSMDCADKIHQEMMLSPYPGVAPDTVSFRMVIFGWAALEDSDAIDRAYELLLEMVRIYETGNTDIEVDATFFSKLISILARRKDTKRAEEIYQRLLDLYEKTGDSRFEPEVHTKRAMIIVYSKTNRQELAQEILEGLEDEADTYNDPSILPSMNHYRDVIKALGEKKDHSGIERAEQLLLRMIDRGLNGNISILPDRGLIGQVLLQWSRSRRKDAAYRTESFLRMIQDLHKETKHRNFKVGSSSFLNVMTCWSKSNLREAAERAEALLFEMQRRYEDGDEAMRPGRHHYTAVITAWAKSGRSDAAENFQDIFDEAVDSYLAGHEDARPDTFTYGAIISAYGQVGSIDGAERHLRLMLDDYRQGNNLAMPTTTVFSMALMSCLRSKDRHAPERALAIFEEMEALARIGEFDVFPNQKSFSLLLEILSKSQSNQYAERIIHVRQELKRLSQR